MVTKERPESESLPAEENRIVELAVAALLECATEDELTPRAGAQAEQLLLRRDLRGLAERLTQASTATFHHGFTSISGLDLGLLESLIDQPDQRRTRKLVLVRLRDLLQRRGWY